MEQTLPTLRHTLKKQFIRFVLSVVGLLVVRGIVGALPMLRSASAIGDSLLSPLVVTLAVIDTLIILLALGFGLNLSREIQTNATKIADLGRIVSRLTIIVVLVIAYKAYELPAACLFVDQSDLITLGKNNTAPAGSFGDFLKVWNQMAGQVTAAAMQNATGDALSNYQKIALAVFRQPPNLYAWGFLLLIAIPAVTVVPLVSRNMDTFTEMVSQATAALDGAANPAGAAVTSNASNATAPEVSGNKATPGYATDKLTKLKTLLDAGAISGEEFAGQKAKLLARPIVELAPDAEDLRKLKTLLDSGVLTQEEYNSCKQRFLEQV
jgi:hypothetical protein